MRSFLLGLLLISLAVCIHGSSHGEAPETSTMPQTDITDLYAFVSYETGRSNYVTLIANWNPKQLPYGGPNYFPLSDQFYYEIYIDQTGDGVPEITYQFAFHNELANNGSGLELRISKFNVGVALKALGPITAGNNADLNELEFYRLNVITPTSSQPVTVAGTGQNFFVKPADYYGTKTFPNYTAYAAQYMYNINLPNCTTPGRLFVGQRTESFRVNLGQIFDLVDFIPIDGASGFPGGINQSDSNDIIHNTNIASMVLEVPTSCIATSAAKGVIGVWAASRSIRGNRQKSRLGNPLFNELIIGLKDKDKWNRRRPNEDRRLLNYLLYPTFPAILNILFGSAVNSVLKTHFATIAPTNFPRNDLVTALLTGIPGINLLQDVSTRRIEMLRLNTSIPPTPAANQSSLGVIAGDLAGFPNGRRLGDDAIDIILRCVMGVLCYAKLGVCTPSDAVVGNVAFTDGAPINAGYFDTTWPYIKTPIPGSQPNL